MASLPKNLSLILIPLLLGSLIASAQAGDTVVYWGQGLADREGTLKAACDTGNYAIVIISCLTAFGSGRTPVLNLAGHCDPSSGGCKGLASDITYCQTKGIKVLLSLGGAIGDYGLALTSDAKLVAEYLWNNYLGGTSSDRPFGSCVLDGIDFNIQKGSGNYYDDLAKFLSAYSSLTIKVYLTAAPQCAYPDLYLGKAISTGLFDYVWVQFYNNPSYEYVVGNILQFTITWNTWVINIKGKTKLFLGLSPSNDAVSSGFIPPNDLISIVLPLVKVSPNYGGIMLFSRYYDVLTNYCGQVKSFV